MILPLTCRRSSLKKRITLSALTESLKIRRNNLGRRPEGLQVMTPITERFFQLPVERMTGVLLFGAQERRTVGRSERPVSSKKPSFTPN
jgi:hypothetical protein